MELNLNAEQYLARFKVYNPKSLFPPNFELLRQGNCPICTRKLYWNMRKDKMFCKSKKSNDKFMITRATLSRLGII